LIQVFCWFFSLEYFHECILVEVEHTVAKLEFVIDFGSAVADDLDDLSGAFVALVSTSKSTPMSPAEGDDWWSCKDFEDFPRKSWE